MSKTIMLKSAQKLDTATLKAVTKFAEQKLGSKVELKELIDTSVIAGFVIEFSGIEYDYSLRGSLNRLSQAI